MKNKDELLKHFEENAAQVRRDGFNELAQVIESTDDSQLTEETKEELSRTAADFREFGNSTIT